MPEPVGSGQRYLPGLDGLRAVAVAAVVMYHLGYGWAQGGLLGVGVFFTLSGYLITDILVGQWTARGRIGLANFWLRRARRLLPALFVMLAVVTVWVQEFARSFQPGFRGDVIASLLYVNNWWYIGQHSSYYARFAPPGPLDHLWSLAVEEQFYLVWPWVVLACVWVAGAVGTRRRRAAGGTGMTGGTGEASGTSGAGERVRWAAGGRYLSPRTRLVLAEVALWLAAASAVAMAVRYQPGYDPTRVYEGTDTRAFGLLAGAALAMAWPTRRPARDQASRKRDDGVDGAGADRAGGGPADGAGGGRARPAAARWLLDGAGAAGLAVIGLLVWRTNQYSDFMFRGGLVLLSAATVAVVAAVVTPGSLLGRALGIRPLRWLGVRSYGIYLWHYPLIVLTAAAGGAGGPVSLGRAVALVAGTVAVAAVSWQLIEEPVRRGTRPRLPFLATTVRMTRTPRSVAGLCLLTTAVLAAGVTVAIRMTPAGAHTAAGPRPSAASTTKPRLSNAGGRAQSTTDTTGGAGTGAVASGTAGPGSAPGAGDTLAVAAPGPMATVPALPTPPPRTSCTAVVHIGDSTSEGLTSPDYLPHPADRITARYADVGVRTSIMKIVGATSIIEALPGTPNAYQMAAQVKQHGFHGCWVLALGTNDTADVFVGSNVGRDQRIEKMMALLGGQPVMWVEVTSLLSGGPYAEQNMKLWNQALQRALPRYPDMRVYDWPAVAQRSWFISDGIHYTTNGYQHRAKAIASALAEAFPAT